MSTLKRNKNHTLLAPVKNSPLLLLKCPNVLTLFGSLFKKIGKAKRKNLSKKGIFLEKNSKSHSTNTRSKKTEKKIFLTKYFELDL